MQVPKSHGDNELISLLKDNKESALTAIYRVYWEELFISAFNVLKDRQACEDIIQEIFIKLWTRRKDLEIAVSLKSYLHASVRYEVFRQIKKGTVREDIFDCFYERILYPSVSVDLEYKELVTRIASIVETLPVKCREVYKLSREEQLSHKEISSRLNISTKTVENHLTKALRILKMSLGEILTVEILSHFLQK